MRLADVAFADGGVAQLLRAMDALDLHNHVG